jgi:hypothetical protein
MSDPEFSIEELCACARRELALRKRVYPRLIDAGKMTVESAVRETQMMQAILDNLQCQQQPRLF